MGGCYRHSTDHFGDEPCASHTFIDNWVDHYYLTGDLRTLEVLREAGGFLRGFHWTEDAQYSFSLRGIGNAFRGLLYLHEVTGDESFLRRAEEVWEVIARGQNDDGSWHKRFQVSTPDRLALQNPYGMASEGTTLAVELGAPPFSDEEHLELRGRDKPIVRVMPYEEQKGYQSHYLLIGVELLHRLTGRQDVAAAYVRAVDWFCGGPGSTGPEFALSQHYYGIVCRAPGLRLAPHRPRVLPGDRPRRPRAAHADAGPERRPQEAGLRGHEPHGPEPAVLRGAVPARGAGRGWDGGAGGLSLRGRAARPANPRRGGSPARRRPGRPPGTMALWLRRKLWQSRLSGWHPEAWANHGPGLQNRTLVALGGTWIVEAQET